MTDTGPDPIDPLRVEVLYEDDLKALDAFAKASHGPEGLALAKVIANLRLSRRASEAHARGMAEALSVYRQALRDIADRPEGSPVNDNRFAADVLKENEP
jgi:hypothetical protein